MDLAQVALLSAAAFGAGAVNAVAGGGSLISFPALIAAGYPAKTANVTNTVALWPGYLGGTLGYRRELRGQRHRVKVLLLPTVVGALAGSAILLLTPSSTFEALVPFLILFASGLLAAQEPLAGVIERRQWGSRGDDHVPAGVVLSVGGMAVYGAYFGAGLGIMLLAMLAILMPDDLQRNNALKGLLSFGINAVAVVYFAFFGPVEWLACLVMAATALAGGYFGVGLARKLGRRWLKWGVVTYGVVVGVVLLVN